MNNILGLSHLVFSLKLNKRISINETLLDHHYKEGEYFEFNHGKIRNNLIRNRENSISKISLFKPLNGDLPAFELLYCKTNFSRSDESFGFILKNKKTSPKSIKKEIKFTNGKFAKCIFDERLSLNIAYSTNLIQDDYGCWITVSDYENQRRFFLNEKSNQVIFEEKDMIVVKCRVINSKFSNFTIALLREQNQEQNNFYNDDLGFSSIGWFQKEAQKKNIQKIFNETDKFEIFLFNKKFKAKFLYNNCSISHELLNI